MKAKPVVLSTWATFERVLATLAGHARQAKRPPDVRLRSLELGVIVILATNKLFSKTNQDVADILAEYKRHSMGSDVSQGPQARVAALRRAVARLQEGP